MRTWLIVAGVALLVAIAAIGGWLLGRRGQAPAYAVSQTAQAGDLRITVLLDAAALGEREIEIVVQDAAGNPADVQSVRLRFGMAVPGKPSLIQRNTWPSVCLPGIMCWLKFAGRGFSPAASGPSPLPSAPWHAAQLAA
jgi:hypothetical protein